MLVVLDNLYPNANAPTNFDYQACSIGHVTLWCPDCLLVEGGDPPLKDTLKSAFMAGCETAFAELQTLKKAADNGTLV